MDAVEQRRVRRRLAQVETEQGAQARIPLRLAARRIPAMHAGIDGLERRCEQTAVRHARGLALTRGAFTAARALARARRTRSTSTISSTLVGT